MEACLLCKRRTAPGSTLCRYHQLAKDNIDSAYSVWKEAYGGMTWKQYLLEVKRSSQTGDWAREVAEFLSKEASG
jgi:hypothetical protein